MALLLPRALPFLFLGIAALFLVNYLRHLRRPDQKLAQRNRLRLVLIFAVVGVIQLFWRTSR
ncbi:MAG: hypothetical protein IPK64_14925 [bacterium]|nr:hypothetical protein [bacterium]